MQGKVEICGVNTARLPVLKGAETRALLEKLLKMVRDLGQDRTFAYTTATNLTSSSACTRPRNHELALRKPMP